MSNSNFSCVLNEINIRKENVMKSTPIFTAVSFVLVALLLALGVGNVRAEETDPVVTETDSSLTEQAPTATDQTPMTPELASKGNRVKVQQSQKITQAQRQKAADDLKALRLKHNQGQIIPAPQ